MSAYKDFIQDFPKRCRVILNRSMSDSRIREYDVTILIMVATSAFTIPFERLNAGRNEVVHQSRDSEKFPNQVKKLDALLKSKFVDSIFYDHSSSWRSGYITDINGVPDAWPDLNKPKILGDDKEVSNVLKSIRNSLAHGSIFTRGNPIEEIIFLGSLHEQKNKYPFISMSPSSFKFFLNEWIELLSSNDIKGLQLEKFIDAA